jgi:hypothetical protein
MLGVLDVLVHLMLELLVLSCRFVEFLEASNWAIDPDDAVVKDIKANIPVLGDPTEKEVIGF